MKNKIGMISSVSIVDDEYERVSFVCVACIFGLYI